MNITNELKEAIESYKAGDKAAFDTIYSESNKYIHTCIANTMNSENRNEDMISDIMQDTYLEISESLGKLEKPESFLFWAGTIAKRKTYKALKANDQYVLLGEDESFENLPDDNNTIPEEIVLDKEKQIQVRGVINTELTEDEKDCVVGYYYNNMKQKEIAEELDMPQNTVGSNLYRAKSKMRKALEGVLAVALVASIALLFVNSSLIRSAINNKKKEEPTTTQEQPTTTRSEEPTTKKEWPTSSGEESTVDEHEPVIEDYVPPVEEPTEAVPPEMLEAPKPSGNTAKTIVPTYDGAASKAIVKAEWNDGTPNAVYVCVFDEDGKILGMEIYAENGFLEGWIKYKYTEDSTGKLTIKEDVIYNQKGAVTNESGIMCGIYASYYVNVLRAHIEGFSYKYDEDGKLLKVIKDTEVVEEYEYYANGNVKREYSYSDIYEYAEDGKLLKILDKDTKEALAEYEYYANGNVKRMYDNGYKDSYMETQEEPYIYEYDENGKPLRQLKGDTLEVVAEYEYGEGRYVNVKVIDPDAGFGEVYEFYKNGKLKSAVTYNETGELYWNVEYSENGRRILSESVGEFSTVGEYDSEGRIIHSCGNGCELYTYEEFTEATANEKGTLSDEGVVSRVTEVVYDKGKKKYSGWNVHKYDVEGKEIGIELYDENDDLLGWREVVYECDKNGNVVAERIKIYNADGILLLDYVKNAYTYEYDSKGNIKTKNWKEGHLIYEYDSNGYVVSEKENASGYNWTTTYEYDSEGKAIGGSTYNDYFAYKLEYKYEGDFVKEIRYDQDKAVAYWDVYDKYNNEYYEGIIQEEDTFIKVSTDAITGYYDKEGKLLKIADDFEEYELYYFYEKLQ